MTSWRISGTKWVGKRDATAGRRMDRKSTNRKELPKKQVIDLTQVEVFDKANNNKTNTS